MNRKKILLHTCCAGCATVAVERLLKEYEVTLLYYNPNIHPPAEYQTRLDDVRMLASSFKVDLMEDHYNPDEFDEVAKGYESEPEGGARCEKCFELRLRKAAQLASKLGFDLFTTTLTLSPHKNSKLITSIGESASDKSQAKYLPSDFKKQGGFAQSVEASRKLNLYRQNYCGCRFSIREK